MDKPYDLSGIRAITGDNVEFLEKVIVLFISSVADDMQLLKDKSGEDNWSEVAALAHKIRSPLSQFGINTLVVEKLENQDGFSIRQLHLFVDELDSELRKVINHLKEEFPGND
ncbi:MAG: Hpt domain-containing protein [Bacteroidota bacterium]|nr:Hpt domain-containing protein [Bacteroidota bacterium]